MDLNRVKGRVRTWRGRVNKCAIFVDELLK